MSGQLIPRIYANYNTLYLDSQGILKTFYFVHLNVSFQTPPFGLIITRIGYAAKSFLRPRFAVSSLSAIA